jgi:hypothetical protein
MRITKATPDDLDTLVAFRDQAAAWLAKQGIEQWQEPWPTEDLMVEGMLRNIEAGETFIVWDDNDTPAATITINRWAKPELWTQEEALGEEPFQVAAPVAQPVVAFSFAQPWSVSSGSSNGYGATSGPRTGSAGAMKTTPATRCGCSAARMSESPMSHQATTIARSTPTASRTATASAATSGRV